MTRAEALAEFKRLERKIEESHRRAHQLCDEGRHAEAQALIADDAPYKRLFVLADIFDGRGLVN